jgi:hypothetical protein
MRHFFALSIVVGLALVAAACGSSGQSTSNLPAGSTPVTTTAPDATNFDGHVVDNEWFPLVPGMTWEYRGVKDGQPSREIMVATSQTKTIQGVPCTVVSDKLSLSGALEERTLDYYAQDKDGNVWYFGEDTAELKPDGSVKSTEGTWLSGRDGAEAGIFMPADPQVGQSFRQEYYKGQAEDHFRVLGYLGKNALLVEETTPLEPGVVDHKLYVRGTGTVLERTVKGGDELNELLSVRR